MDKIYDLELEQPISVWYQAISFDAKEFFTALGKVVVNVAAQDAKGIAENVLDMLKSAGIEGKSPNVVAWHLINSALNKSIYDILLEYVNVLNTPLEVESEVEDLALLLSKAMGAKTIGINHDFFSRPKSLSLLNTLEQPLTDWFMGLGISVADANAMYLRLRDYLPIALHQQWLSDTSLYGPVQDALTSPFLAASRAEREWLMYGAWLQGEANKTVFSEAFGLRQVYVPLRGYYEIRADEECLDNTPSQKATEKIVVCVDDEIKLWVQSFDKSSVVKVLSGGPGSGKSSAAKILAADISKELSEVSVLFIPLQHFDIEDDLNSAIERFIRDDKYLTINPLDSALGRERLLIIFDGLDELSMRGKGTAEVANDFIDEVITKIHRFNLQGSKIQALITGRDVSVQSAETKLRDDNQVLNFLPYYLSDSEISKYKDPKGILKEDQRVVWWNKYGAAKGKDYSGLPDEISTESLIPITKEPLLNYLVALAYEGGRVDFSNTITLNTIYADLLKAVHSRQWDTSGNHPGTCGLTTVHFERVLEEIAMAVWHGHGRTATLSSIQAACEKANLKKQLEQFEGSAQKGVTRLLTAFYFRESDTTVDNENTFEFTHKSFGEYLIARRVARQFNKIHKSLQLHYDDFDFPYSEQRALLDWLEVCGPSSLDIYIYTFLLNEVKKDDSFTVEHGFTAVRLLTLAIKLKWPIDKFMDGPFVNKVKVVKNVNRSLLAMHHCLMVDSEITSKLTESFSEFEISSWLEDNIVSAGDLSDGSHAGITHLDFSNQHMPALSFMFHNIHHCSFESSNLAFSSFLNNQITHAKFDDTELYGAKFNNMRIINSSYREATVSNSSTSECRFVTSDMENIDFSGSYIEKSIFEKCALDGFSVGYSMLNRVKFKESTILRGKFQATNMIGVEFSEVDLTGSHINSGMLVDTVFDKVNLSGVDFSAPAPESSLVHEINVDSIFINVKFIDVIFDEDTVFTDKQLESLTDEQKEQYLALKRTKS
ncbi:pentapeptide repeat-containing protein [Vibrio splendidus]